MANAVIEANKDFVAGLPRPGRHFELELAFIYRAILSEGGNALDGGTAGGLHSIGMLSSLNRSHGRVISVEPQEDRLELAKHWADRLGILDRMISVTAALGEEQGTATFYVHKEVPARSSLRNAFLPEGTIEPTDVQMVRIDDLCAELPVAFIKLDIERGEYHALLGAEKTILRDHPAIGFESGVARSAAAFNYDEDAVFRFFDALGYAVYDFYGAEVSVGAGNIHTAAYMKVAAERGGRREQLVVNAIDDFWQRVGQYRIENWKDLCQAVESLTNS